MAPTWKTYSLKHSSRLHLGSHPTKLIKLKCLNSSNHGSSPPRSKPKKLHYCEFKIISEHLNSFWDSTKELHDISEVLDSEAEVSKQTVPWAKITAEPGKSGWQQPSWLGQHILRTPSLIWNMQWNPQEPDLPWERIKSLHFSRSQSPSH